MAVRRLFRYRRHSARGLTALAATIAATVTAAALLWPGHHSAAPHQPRVIVADVSGRATACLASDSATAARTSEVAQVWTAMQTAGTQGTKNIQQLIEPAANATQAQPYLASLITQHCDLIITVGPAFGQAVPALAKADPTVRFTAVDSSLTSSPADVTLVEPQQANELVQQQLQGLRHNTTSHP
ncbi:hypothetical protein OG455_10220 [Kitasatospora sp. NBC_01287]|uniref:hypothetical protein n=1 Tax=Kitasatospora sp. NBC_01287 TaxID=2903573 RepID=UPI0022524792|nr:hypothetical protein [Kitasatospora sp. NBC_01287]MCX4745895.1 hypothetical protein [Kitasatospora sp. NBC_01287]